MRNDENFQPLRRKVRQGRSAYRRATYVAQGEAKSAAREAGCTKLVYGTKRIAERAGREINAARANRPKHIHHAYRCPQCDAFHLTSWPRRFRVHVDG